MRDFSESHRADRDADDPCSWRDPSVPLSDEDAFEAIKAGVDAMPEGVKMFLNSGQFFGCICT